MDLTRLRDRTRGALLEPGDEGYAEACTLWNARVEKRPAAVLRCRGAADVLTGVEVARDSSLPFSVRSGGHHVSGSALADGGLTLDLRPMDWVRVDPDRERAWVGPGATWGDVDHETGAFGLAVPGGQDPNIGVAGLTLGGGVGWLSRRYGLTCDNLRSADVVTADGDLVRASASENEDLFWALRGGGGSFGVVTTFEFDLHPVGEVFAGSLVHPHDRAGALARRYESFLADAPREVRLLFGSMVLPAASYFPESVHDTRVAICIVCYAGDPEAGREVLEPLREFGDPLFDSLRARPYAAFQRAGESRGSMRTHLRSQYLDSLSAGAVETVTGWAERAPSAGATVFVSPRSGAETDPPADATAYPHREDAHHLLVEARWDDPTDDEAHVDWVESFHEAVEPYTTGEVAANFVGSEEGERRERAAYGENYERLVEVKRRWDPEGLFRATPALAPD
ncbi:FAD-binding oxidoreductase [Salinirubellus salinus]|uniref:FAD-binding oxidoreductase n=1 Tax=Salinirubellus salinus TaxID=1364945 RepID=A0A9E7UAV5_9EURY|nr:FAD-binding oxidoreductase [Salinirubellus salinus]UWM54603.1 FAD-binding oxidoreductase [Salinirubellus salinus]